jgi:predicted RNA-binding protein with PUA-like domain
MPCWLVKEEPDHYSYADLERDKTTLWDGVANNLARLNLRKMKRGDRLLYYHTGKEKAVVGEAQVIGGPQADPNDADPKAVVVKIKAVRPWPKAVPLAQIKADPQLKDWELVRLPRLSVLPISEAQWQRVEELARQPG